MELVELGLVYYPSTRAIAYANEFIKRDLAPREILVLRKEIPEMDRLMEEDRRFGYTDHFFPVDKNILSRFENGATSIQYIDAADINDSAVVEAVRSGKTGTYIFSGGGILKKDILSCGKRFIHVHPGSLPEYRGSTCFYYSMVEEGKLYSAAFYMEEDLDKGDIITQSRFDINYYINPDQTFFIDYVVDPYIRAITLGKVIDSFSNNKMRISPQPHCLKPAYFIAHPFIRHLAISKLNRQFSNEQATGIFEC